MDDLERSDDYYRKLCLEKHGIVPTQTEVKSRLGDALTKTFFETCMPVLKPYLGLCPYLQGPGDDLWVSPSDLLIGKVKLKPPLTSKHIQALTHQGIVDIGEKIEEHYNNIHELDKQKAFAENEELLRFIFAREKESAIAEVREEERILKEQLAAHLREEFSVQLENEMNLLEGRLLLEKNEAVISCRLETEKLMQIKLELAVLETVHRLTEHFAEELIKQSKRLHEHFWYHIRQEKKKRKQSLAEQQSKCHEKIEKLRTEMQCENIANIMYVLAKERRKCACEKQALEQNFLARLNELEKELEERGDKLQTATCNLEKLGHDVRARETAMFEIIKQFQKFIYFVLRSVPTQAEYLLNIEKLMIFELTSSVMVTKPTYFETVCKDELSAPPPSGASSGSTPEREESKGLSGMVAPDFHECDNYVRYIPSAQTLGEGEDLPAFTYNENLYVREDFRNMISQGLKISKSNEFWNFAVEDLQETLKPDITEIESHKSVVISQITCVNISPAIEERVIQNLSYSEPLTPTPTLNDTTALSEVDLDIEEDLVNIEAQRAAANKIRMSSRLQFARNSLELLKEKIEQKSHEDISAKKRTSRLSNFEMRERTDSLILSARKSAESRLSGTKEILSRKKDSKLQLAVDSLELLKSNATLRSGHMDSVPCTHVKGANLITKRHYANVGVQVSQQMKAVQISHYEVIPTEMEQNKTSVMFLGRPKVIRSDEGDTKECDEKKLPLKWRDPDEIYARPVKCQVLGDSSFPVHLENQQEFVANRVNSFVRIFKEHPSLRRLFTEVHNK